MLQRCSDKLVLSVVAHYLQSCSASQVKVKTQKQLQVRVRVLICVWGRGRHNLIYAGQSFDNILYQSTFNSISIQFYLYSPKSQQQLPHYITTLYSLDQQELVENVLLLTCQDCNSPDRTILLLSRKLRAENISESKIAPKMLRKDSCVFTAL